MDFLIASNNSNKINEIKQILSSYKKINFINKKLDIEILENGKSFLQNAYIKAKTIFNITGYSCIADDSGLEIKALNNMPGIYSARYKNQICKNDYERNLWILNKMKNKIDRSARFICCMVLFFDKKNIYFFYGYCYGHITNSIKGKNGFGYDAIFYPNSYNKTLAELNYNEKNKISHRYYALLKLKMFLNAKD